MPSPTSLLNGLDRHQIVSAAMNPNYVGGNSRPRRMTHDMADIFNSAPWTVEPQISGNGGLKNAVQRAQADGTIDQVLWIGSLGMPTDSLNTSTRQAIETTLRNTYHVQPVFVKDGTLEGHYNHYCKQILWPTLHYQIPDNPKSKAYEDHSWELYKAMNQSVADAIVKEYKKGDTIWINDYHLFLTPKMVRDKLPDAKIGFFMHVSFPSSEVFRCLAARSQLLEGVLAADCIGFQIPEYARHFLQTCNRILAVDTTPFGVRLPKRFVSVVVDAIGIDPDSLQVFLQDEEVQRWRKLIRERWPDIQLIVGRDKLDNIKGVKQKLQAYELFLKKHPEMIDKVVLIQVCLMNKSEPELESDVSTLVDRINSMRSNLAANQPCVFLHKDIDFTQYIALIAEAKAFAVTSVREGMNLTCHEFIYCNDLSGPLILSEFTGAASVLGPAAILVNPWDRTEMAEAFYNAVTMDEEEKKRRWTVLYDLVTHNTCVTWINDFLNHMDLAWAEQQRRKLAAIPQLDMSKLRDDYQSVTERYRLFFLDLDYVTNIEEGTDYRLRAYPARAMRRSSSTNSLFSINSLSSTSSSKNPKSTSSTINNNGSNVYSSSYHYSGLNSKLLDGKSHSTVNMVYTRNQKHGQFVSLHRKLSMLYELVGDPKNIVYIFSQDSRSTLERLFKHVPNIGVIAQNGAFLRPFGSDEWIGLLDKEETQEWQTTLNAMLRDVVVRLPGSKMEVNGSMTTLLLDDCAEKDRTSSSIGELVNHVNDAFASYEVHAIFQNNRVKIASTRHTKFAAIKRAFIKEKTRLREDTSIHVEEGFSPIEMIFIAAEGDDAENDQIFEWANSLPNGICGVGMHQTDAETSNESLYFGSPRESDLTPTTSFTSGPEKETPAETSSLQSYRDAESASINSDANDRVDMFNSVARTSKIPIAYTVSVGGRGTYPQSMVDGLNGLVNVLLNALRQPSSYE
jgi:trehalose 6-phosphate synthase/phosphatase